MMDPFLQFRRRNKLILTKTLFKSCTILVLHLTRYEWCETAVVSKKSDTCKRERMNSLLCILALSRSLWLSYIRVATQKAESWYSAKEEYKLHLEILMFFIYQWRQYLMYWLTVLLLISPCINIYNVWHIFNNGKSQAKTDLIDNIF